MGRTSPGVVFLTLLQIGCSVAVITLTNNFLVADSSWGSTHLCYLNGDKHDASMCSFAVAVGVVSICSALLSGFLRCVSCDFCGLGPVSNILLAVLNSLWWLVSAAILTAGAVAADVSGLPKGRYRHTLIAVAWTAAVAEFIHSILACVVVGNNICNWIFCVPPTPHDEECCVSCEESCSGCCCPCCCPRQRHRHHQPQHTQPLLHPDTAAAAAAAGLAASAALSKRVWWGGVQRQSRPQSVGSAGGWGPQRPPAAAWQQPTAAAAAAARPPAAGGFMPPPPTAGQPYIYHPAAPGQAVGVPYTHGSSSASGAADSGTSFGGFVHHEPAGVAAATPTGFTNTAATAPYAPPVVIQQQQQQVVPPTRPSMSADLYPSISKG